MDLHLKSRSLFISFEGVEGAGKSTQLRLLARRLRQEGIDPVETREPGGTAVGQAIRKLFLDARHTGMSPSTELLLINADRAQHLSEVILPSLACGRVVLCDRFVDSTRAYQGGGRGLDRALIESLHQQIAQGRQPDRTYWLDLDPEKGLFRARARQVGFSFDRLEQDTLAFHQRIARAFAELYEAQPNRIVHIDAGAGRDEETIHQDIWEDCLELLEAK